MTARSIENIVAPLFVPGHRPERFAKAAQSGADAIIIDLEDAVPADAKDVARDALRQELPDIAIIVRVNASATPWHQADVAALAGLPIAGVMLPKTELPTDAAAFDPDVALIGLVETARGIDGARDIARSGRFARLAFGSVDFAADLGCAHIRETLAAARAELVLASRLGGLAAPIDGVTLQAKDGEITADDARYARSFGFGGKLAIHPMQIDAIFAGFRPSDDEIAWAERVIASGDGAVAVDGMMVDEPVRMRARLILSRARALR